MAPMEAAVWRHGGKSAMYVEALSSLLSTKIHVFILTDLFFNIKYVTT